MLVQFMIKNVLSFKEETTIDMTAIHAYKEHQNNLIDIGTKEKFLRVSAIYGANASGKSNLYIAMTIFQSIIYESFNNVDHAKNTALEKYYQPFLFEENQEDSEFQIVEILGEFEYCYGFEYNAEHIVTEWLYRKNIKTNKSVTIFERTKDSVSFGRVIRKECEIYKDQIPTETLVVSFFNKLKLKTDIFKKLYSSILDGILVIPTDFYEDISILDTVLPKLIDEDKKKLEKFLCSIDTGICDISYDDSEKEIKFITSHVGKDGKQYYLNLFSESAGTIKSIIVFIYACVAIEDNYSIFVDELNEKFHPLLLKFIVDLFYNKNSTAQLIYTTHDTTLMDKKFFRRDQIWFVQKNEFGYSELIALSDFKVRSDASFEKDYLAGVFGGIPLLEKFTLKEGE